MTKQAHREAQRVAPLGLDGIAKIRQIVAERQAQKVNEVFVDGFSASAIAQVYDALNEANREKFIALPVARAAKVAFSLVKS